MAISLKEFVKRSLEEMAALFSRDKCPECKGDFDTHPDEQQYTINGRPVCSDCYFNELGEEIEKHPIGTPRATGIRMSYAN